MKKYLLELPQNIIGFFFYIFNKKRIKYDTLLNLLYEYRNDLNVKQIKEYKDDNLEYKVYMIDDSDFISFCVGKYIFLNSNLYLYSVLHEFGHRKQSKEYKWLYLFKIGIPSIIFNIYDRIAHKKWEPNDRINWYYTLPWERDANDRSGIKFVNNTWVYIN